MMQTPEEHEELRQSVLRSADAVAAKALAMGLVDYDQAEALQAALRDIVERGDWQRAADLNR